MSRPKLKNIAASVRQRLLNEARATDRPFNELLQYFAMERFLYRLGRSSHSDRFVLKGALMLTSWNLAATRPTRDIDLLCHGSNDIDAIVTVVRDVCGQSVEPDGLDFDPRTVQGDRIAQQAEYEGVRACFKGTLGTARIPMQIDVGFGDVVVPAPRFIDYPTILDLPAPRLRGYTRESMVAEKVSAMVAKGILNSRMRDFFDIWALSRQFRFNGDVLATAIAHTFAQRNLGVDPHPPALTDAFAADPSKAAQWRGFLRKGRLQNTPPDLAQVVHGIATFLLPVLQAVADGRDLNATWPPGGPWEPKPR